MLSEFITTPTAFPLTYGTPWEITNHLCEILNRLIQNLDDSYAIANGQTSTTHRTRPIITIC